MKSGKMVLTGAPSDVVTKAEEFAKQHGLEFEVGTGLSLVSGSVEGKVLSFQPAQDRPISEMEKDAIQAAVDRYRGNLTEAAKVLGIGRATLYRKIKEYQINPATSRRSKAA